MLLHLRGRKGEGWGGGGCSMVGQEAGDSSFLLLKIGIPLDFGEKGRKAGLIVLDFDSFEN